MQSALLLVLLNLGSVLRIATLWRCIASGVLKRHVFFFALTILSSARSILAATGALHPLYEFWLATQWPMAALQTAAASVGFLRTRWDSPLRTPLLVDQFTGLWLVLTALLSLAFFKQFPKVPVRPNAIRHLTALSILFGTNFIAYSIGQLSRGQWRFQTNLVIYCGAILGYGWWALKMNRGGEALPFAPPPPMSPAEFDAAEAAHRLSARELKRAGSEALRRTLRS